MKQLPIVLALALFVSCAGQVSAQTFPAIPEPGLILYGSVINTNASGSGTLGAGVINWTITGNNSTSSVPTTIVNVNGQYFYVAQLPFETRQIGTDTFAATPNTLQFSAAGAIYNRSATVNGSNAVMAFSSSGNLAMFGFGRTNQGSVERVDLQVNLQIESFQQWALRYFGTTNINPNADADGDGMSNYQEYLAGTDPTDKNSLFIMTRSSPDSQGGTDVSWLSVSNKTYTLLRTDDLTQPFTIVQSGIAGTAPTNTFYDPDATGSGPWFYRARLDPAFPAKSQPPFQLIGILPDPAGGIDLSWQSTVNNTYSIYRSTNLFQGFVAIQSWIPASPGTNTFRDLTATESGPYFYRVRTD